MKGSMLAAFAMSLGLFAGVAGTQTASAMVLPAIGTSTEAIAHAPVTMVQMWRGHPRAGWRPGYRWRPGYGWVAPAVVGAVIAGAAVGAAVAGPGPYYAPPPPPPPAPYPYYGPAPYYGGPRY